MPDACLDPNGTFEFILGEALTASGANRVLILRFMSARQSREYYARIEATTEAGISDTEYINRQIEALKMPLVGWRNITDEDGQPLTYAPDVIDQGLSVLDITYALNRFEVEAAKQEADEKKLHSPSPSATASSDAGQPETTRVDAPAALDEASGRSGSRPSTVPSATPHDSSPEATEKSAVADATDAAPTC